MSEIDKKEKVELVKNMELVIETPQKPNDTTDLAEDIVNSIRKLVIALDKDLKVIKVSRSVYDFFKINDDEIIGKLIYDVAHNQWDINKLKGHLEKILSENSTVENYELEHSISDVNKRFLSLSAHQIQRVLGKEHIIMLVLEDITERKQADALLALSHREFVDLLDSLNDAVFSLDIVNNKMIIVSAAHEAVFGYPPEAFFKNPGLVFERILPEDKPIIDAGLQVLNTGKRLQHEVRITRADGEIRWIESKIKPTLDNSGKLIRVDGVISDITERKQAEKELDESRHLFQTLTQVSPVGIFRTNLDGYTTYVNPRWSELSGISTDEALGFGWLKAVHPGDRERLSQKWQTDIKVLKPSTAEYRFLKSDGEIVWVLGNAVPEIVDNKVCGYIGTATDITQQKKAEKALVKSEQRFRELFNKAPVGYHEINYDGKIVEINQTELDLLGYTREEMIGAFVWTFAEDVESSRKRVFGKLQAKLPAGEGCDRKYLKKDKTSITFLVEDRLLKDENGYVTGLRSTLQDITKKRKDEEDLHKFLLTAEQSPVSILITNYEGVIEYVNRKFCQMTNFSKEDVIGKNHQAFSTNMFVKTFNKILWNTILSGKDFKGEIRNKKKSGELYWESVFVFPLVNKEGKTTHFVGIREDITEQKRMVDELIIAKNKAEEMNRLKSNFLANMSHELRTPLIGILGYSEILTAELQDPEQIKMAETITESGKRLKKTVNLILDLSKVESQQIDILNHPQNIILLLQECIDLYISEAEKKGLYLKLVMPGNQLIVNYDKRFMTDILNNLLQNAIVYTNSGGITVTMYEQLISGKPWVCIGITDTGIGIAQKDFKRIYEEFRQVSEGRSRGFEGTGLGLTLVKKYVELLGGLISLESELGVGSTFTIKFQLVDANSALGEPVADTTLTPAHEHVQLKRIPLLLYVEDDEISRKVVERMLRGICTLDFALSGTDVFKLTANNTYDAILMDIHLGNGSDGGMLTKELRALPQYVTTPIIAVTAFALQGDKEDFLKSGCSDYISKPFTKQALIDVIKRSGIGTTHDKK